MKDKTIDRVIGRGIQAVAGIYLVVLVGQYRGALWEELTGVPLTQEFAEFLSLMLQVWGLIATMALTFMLRRKAWAIAIGPVLGFIVTVVGQIAIAGGGPAECASVFVFPLYGWLVSRVTLALSRWFSAKGDNPAQHTLCGHHEGAGEDGA